MCNLDCPRPPADAVEGANLRLCPPTGGGAGSVPASLDALETSDDHFMLEGERVPSVSRWSNHRHRRWREERAAIYQALLTSAEPLDRKRLDRILWCNASPVLFATDSGEVRTGSRYCRDRLCPLCNSRRSDEIARKVTAMVQSGATCRFLTLTLRSSDAPLREQLDHLTEAWRRLRQRDSWKHHVRAAVGTIEVTWNESTARWHPHLHIIFDGRYWEQSAISREWCEVTNGSSIVDVRAVPDRRKTVRYIAKYAAKPAKIGTLPAERIREWSHTVHRRRMVIAVGAWAKFKPHEETELEPLPKQREVCGMHELARMAREGMPRVIRVVQTLWRIMPEVSSVIGMPFRPNDAEEREPSIEERLILRWDLLYIRQRLGEHQAPDGPLLRLRQLQPTPPVKSGHLWPTDSP